jgi:hypothetical protein
VGAVSVLRYHFEAVNGIDIANNIVQDIWSVFFNPIAPKSEVYPETFLYTYHGSSYGMSEARVALFVDEDMMKTRQVTLL